MNEWSEPDISKISRMNCRTAITAALLLIGCMSVSTADQGAPTQTGEGSRRRAEVRLPENKLSCSGSHRSQSVESHPFTKPSPKSVTDAAQRARLLKSALSREAQARLDAADTTTKLQSLVLDTLNREGSGIHSYSFAAGQCALTKSYDDLGYRESVCLQPKGIVAGNNGDIGVIGNGEDAFRKTITLWMLYVNCVGKGCAVYTEGNKPEYMDSYFFGTPFSSEDEMLLTSKGLEKLAESCTRSSKR